MTAVSGDRLAFLDGLVPPEEGKVLTRMRNRESWGIYHSSLRSYDRDANLPKGISLRRILNTQLAGHDENIGIDIAGGTGRALMHLVKKGLLSDGIVTNYKNTHPRYRYHNPLHYVEGDLLERQTWMNIDTKVQEIAPRGLAVVLHRPWAALQHHDSQLYEGSAHFWLDRLRPGGVLFSQIPSSLCLPSGKHVRANICRSITNREDVESVFASSAQHTYRSSMRMQSVIITKRSG